MSAYKKLISGGLDFESDYAVIITSPHNLRYFTGFTGGEALAVISDKRKILITDFRYIEQAENESPDFEIFDLSGDKRYEFLKNECSDCSKLLFEDRYMNVCEYNIIGEKTGFERLIGASEKIEKLRMIKEEWEIERISKAEEIGSLAFSHILKFIKEGVTENDIALELEYFMRKNGAEGLSFDTISISGEKTSLPHGQPSSKKIKCGEFITMDFGCIYKGYCSDMTRTVVLGRASEKQKEIYEIVRLAQETGLKALKSGIKCCDADKAAREVIEKAGYGKNFGHSLGHGVGLLIHELPNVSPRSDIVLEENMVVSCEPGIYIPNFGGVRIEDLVCIKKDGVLNLTSAEKKLIEL